MKHYLTEVVYDKKRYFMIWYSGDEDGFLLSDQRLLVFPSIEEANIFAQKEKITFETEESVYDFSDLIGLINNVQLPENCRVLIDAWNFFSDLSKTLNETFVGESDEEATIAIYDKLFRGCNLEILKSEEYHPVFDDKETCNCRAVFLNGLSILKKQLSLNGNAADSTVSD